MMCSDQRVTRCSTFMRACFFLRSTVEPGYLLLKSLFLVASFMLIVCSTSISAGEELDKPVARYALQCDDTFSCPDSLLPRVGFWVEVFSRWDTNTAIFHDKENPHRVYSTVARNEGCRRSRKGDSISRERKKLKKALETLADRLASGKSLTDSQARLFKLFPGESAKQVRAASNRVRCQSGNKDRMREALAQFQLYRPTILDALESQNLTPELQYLPFVESAFNPQALSHVGAAGLWQIMPSTGRSLGLQVDTRVDERYDPKSATYAAALYFRNSVDDLSETAFENGHKVQARELNPFVITSYNYGVSGMQRAIRQVGLDYERLLVEYKSPSFQTAVKNFYASFLAARHVAKNVEKFFGVVAVDRSQRLFDYDTEPLKRATSAKRVSKSLNVEVDTLKRLNPALKKIVWQHKALIPKGYKLRLPFREQGWNTSMVAMNSLPRETEKSGFTWHRVKRGQTACGIAERYKASCNALRKINRLDKKGTIYVGRRIKVPTRSGGIVVAKSGDSNGFESTPSNTSAVTASSNANMQTYRVRRGDTSCSIANRYGMLCGEFLAINGLKRNSLIQIDQRVRVTAADSWHIVKSGQTACGIADSYRVACNALLDANKLKRRSVIQVGQRLRIPSKL